MQSSRGLTDEEEKETKGKEEDGRLQAPASFHIFYSWSRHRNTEGEKGEKE